MLEPLLPFTTISFRPFQESPPHATEPADAESVARALGYDPLLDGFPKSFMRVILWHPSIFMFNSALEVSYSFGIVLVT